MRMMDKDYTAAKRILEINTAHPLIMNLSKLLDGKNEPDLVTKCVNQIYEGAMLIDGNLTNPIDFVNRMSELMIKATN